MTARCCVSVRRQTAREHSTDVTAAAVAAFRTCLQWLRQCVSQEGVSRFTGAAAEKRGVGLGGGSSCGL